jgi:hypothetical protein
LNRSRSRVKIVEIFDNGPPGPWFEGRNKSAIVAELMLKAVAERRAQAKLVGAFDVLMADKWVMREPAIEPRVAKALVLLRVARAGKYRRAPHDQLADASD